MTSMRSFESMLLVRFQMTVFNLQYENCIHIHAVRARACG